MSGSVGGVTASHNRGGTYFRRRVVPTNPNSQQQQAIRGGFGGIVNAWQPQLSDAQRQGWKDYALNTPRTDVIGQALVLTGQQAYIGANSARMQAANLGLSIADVSPPRVDQPPAIFNTGESITGVNMSFGIPVGSTDCFISGGFSAPLSEAALMFLFIGRAINPTVNFYKSPFSLAAYNAIPAGATSFEFLADMTDPTQWAWPNPATAQQIQGAVAAFASVTIDGANVGDATSVTIGGRTYTFQTTLTNVDGNVKIGGSADATAANLFNAITLGAGAGTVYAAATTANAEVTASEGAGSSVVVTALTSGPSGNSVAVSSDTGDAVWSSASLQGGTDAARYPLRLVLSFNDGRYSQAFSTIQYVEEI